MSQQSAGSQDRAAVAPPLLLTNRVANEGEFGQPEVMDMQDSAPKKLSDFKGNIPRVSVSQGSGDEADLLATQSLLQLYTQDDGFHCPICQVVIKSPEKAVYHLADEINKSLDALGR